MKKYFSLVQKSQKALRMGPKIIKKPTKSKPGPHRVLPCALQCPRIVPGSSPQDRPRIVPGSPRTPKERFQACQMIPMGTKIHQKSIKIKAWTSKCCFVVCYGTHLEASGSYKVAPAEKPAPSAQREGPAAVGVALKILKGET